MKIGDWVVYSASHFDWLVMAGRWPRSDANYKGARTKYTGQVQRGGAPGDHDGLVRVSWPAGAVTWHFPENIEPAPPSP